MTEPMEMPSLDDLAPDPFAQKLERLKWIYSQMEMAFGVERQLLQEERQANVDRDPDSYKEWEHLIFDEQECDLEARNKLRAEFVLVSLADTVRELLKEAKSEVDRTTRDSSVGVSNIANDRKSKKSRGDWLTRFREFFQESQIDLAGHAEWDRVQEVVAARNVIQHPESLQNYLTCHRDPRYLNENAEVQLTRGEINATVNGLRDFGAWLRDQITAGSRKTGT